MEPSILEQITMVGELIASVAVVISLIYLGRQMRQNTQAVQINAAQEYVQMFNTFTSELGGTEEMADIWYRGTSNYESLTKIEVVRFHALVAQWMKIMESAYQQWKHGAVDDDTWIGISNLQKDTVCMPGIVIWREIRGHWHGPEFLNWIDEFMQSSDGKPLYGHLENRD
jgi:hypothetical protein